jgi:hypothetical protein
MLLKLHHYEDALMDTILSLEEEIDLRVLIRFAKAAKNTGQQFHKNNQ